MSYIEWIRGRVGHRKIFLAFASVVLQNDEGGVLLQCRTDFGVWGLPGGTLERGEDILNCARRELVEETGLTAGQLRLVGIYTDPRYDTCYPNGDQVQQYTICFQSYANGGKMQVDGTENSEQRFFLPGEIPYEQMPSYYAAMVRDALGGGPPAFQTPYSRPETVDQIKMIRALIGKDWYIGVGAGSVTVRDDGRILMQQRKDDGFWDFPWGYMHLGENAAYTTIREMEEETGLRVALERILGIYSLKNAWIYPNSDQVQGLLTLFRAHPVGGSLRAYQGETRQLAWMSPAEILQLGSPPPFKALFREVVRHLDEGHFVLGE